jgi:hypothetical protein
MCRHDDREHVGERREVVAGRPRASPSSSGVRNGSASSTSRIGRVSRTGDASANDVTTPVRI